MVQVDSDLLLHFDHSLQQLLNLSCTLQAFAEQNWVHSQQLRYQQGMTGKVGTPFGDR